MPKESALSLVLVEEIVIVDRKSHKRKIKEVDFVFKNSKRPRLKFGKKQAFSTFSFKRSETLLKIIKEPFSNKAENHNQLPIVRGKHKRFWGEIVVFPPPFKKRYMISAQSTSSKKRERE